MAKIKISGPKKCYSSLYIQLIHKNELLKLLQDKVSSYRKIPRTGKHLQVSEYLCRSGSVQIRSSFDHNCTVPTHLSIISSHSLRYLASLLLSARDSEHVTFSSTCPHGVFVSNLKHSLEMKRKGKSLPVF